MLDSFVSTKLGVNPRDSFRAVLFVDNYDNGRAYHDIMILVGHSQAQN